MTSPTPEPEMQLGVTMQYAETDAEMGGAGAGTNIVNNIYEAVSAQATAMQVARRQIALSA